MVPSYFIYVSTVLYIYWKRLCMYYIENNQYTNSAQCTERQDFAIQIKSFKHCKFLINTIVKVVRINAKK